MNLYCKYPYCNVKPRNSKDGYCSNPAHRPEQQLEKLVTQIKANAVKDRRRQSNLTIAKLRSIQNQREFALSQLQEAKAKPGFLNRNVRKAQQKVDAANTSLEEHLASNPN